MRVKVGMRAKVRTRRRNEEEWDEEEEDGQQ